MTVKTDVPNDHRLSAGTAERSEPAAGRPGRSIKGTGALTEFDVEAAAGRRARASRPSQDRQGHGRLSIRPRRRSEPMFDDKSGTKRVTGPVEFAIDGKDETAWGIDAGPAAATAAQGGLHRRTSRSRFAGGTILTFHLKQNHGGWNSDDNQNNNLGPLPPLDHHRSPTPWPIRSRQPSATSSPSRRDQRTPAQTAAVFSYWRTTVPEWKEANDRIEALWRQHPEGASQLVLRERATAARDAPAQARRFSQAGPGG